MRWIGWLFQNNQRRLEISTGGKWFIVFTIVLGVVAINSGNNVIYLLESLLLSSLIFSGVLSELTLSRLKFHREPRQAVAGAPTGDILVLRNTGWLPLYCVEIGELIGGRFYPLHFVLQIPRGGVLRLPSSQILLNRGRHQWDGLALGTSFPFGFARKLRLLPQAGSRIVWPMAYDSDVLPNSSGQGEWEPSEGEIEEVQPWDDLRRVHWPSSSRSDRLMARPRTRQENDELVVLPLDGSAQENEKKIMAASARLQGRAKTLLLFHRGELSRIDGSWRALDALALLPKDAS